MFRRIFLVNGYRIGFRGLNQLKNIRDFNSANTYHNGEDICRAQPCEDGQVSVIEPANLGKTDLVQPGFNESPLLADSSFEPITPIASPSFNIASFVNKSHFLQQMMNLGVSIHKWDNKQDVCSWIVKLDFKRNAEPVIKFLVDKGIPPDALGKYLTLNPHIFKENIEDLEIRTNYLYAKNFTPDMVAKIFIRNPYWLLFSTERIDNRLGFFQKVFHLTGSEIRATVTKESRLVTCKLDNIKLINFGFKEEMGFESNQIKALLLRKPKLWIMDKDILVERFAYLHNSMKMNHETILQYPGVLTCREFRLKQRHEFLLHLNRAQYDPKMPNYVSPYDLVSESDSSFAANIAKSSVIVFNDFCKTL